MFFASMLLDLRHDLLFAVAANLPIAVFWPNVGALEIEFVFTFVRILRNIRIHRVSPSGELSSQCKVAATSYIPLSGSFFYQWSVEISAHHSELRLQRLLSIRALTTNRVEPTVARLSILLPRSEEASQ